ncbi:MAG: hypothetical protein C0469_00045 [Cyanobacteria bacterium DS2.3.42]|nr:hypothetical protein [Cyanobacteria bacterium DS2.3.42]
MRCFTFDKCKILPGIRFQRINGIEIAGKAVGFDDSLIFSSTSNSHFGQYIIRAAVQKEGNRVSLAYAANDENGALLRVCVPISKGSKLSFRGEQPGVTKLIDGVYYRGFFENGSLFRCLVFEGLIQFDQRGEFTLVEEIQKPLTRVQAFMGLEPQAPIVRKARFIYDGYKISYRLEEPKGSEPYHAEETYGGQSANVPDTIRLITEMIENQEHIG